MNIFKSLNDAMRVRDLYKANGNIKDVKPRGEGWVLVDSKVQLSERRSQFKSMSNLLAHEINNARINGWDIELPKETDTSFTVTHRFWGKTEIKTFLPSTDESMKSMAQFIRYMETLNDLGGKEMRGMA